MVAIKEKIDQMAWYLMQAFESNPIESKDKLAAAYSATGTYYDLNYCPPTNWELAPPDGLVDSRAFLEEIANQNISTGVTLRALQAATLVDNAVISQTAKSGTPWFAEPLTPTWTLTNPNASGLALYADMQGNASGSERVLSWHASFYTDTAVLTLPNQTTISNPNPYLFVQGGYNGATWADAFYKYWQIKSQDEALTLRATGCLPDLPPMRQEGELSVEQIIFPVQGSVYQNYPAKLAAAIGTVQRATNPLVRFSVVDASQTLVFSDTVAAGYLVTGTHYIEATKMWTPTITGPFTLTVMVDPDDLFQEQNENNNTQSWTDAVFTGTPFQMDVSTQNNRQWFDTSTIGLELASNVATIDYLVVQIYGYSAGSNPNTQVPSLLHPLNVTSPALPNFSFAMPPTVEAGPITLHLWGIANGELSQEVSIVNFNYAPAQTQLTSTPDYFDFDADAGDALEITLAVATGNATLVIWQPGNFWTAESVTVDAGSQGTITFSPALAGKYLVKVAGTAGSQYTISSMRNGQAGRSISQLALPSTSNPVTTVQLARPFFVAPIPVAPDMAAASAQSSISLQGRPAPPHERWRVPLSVSLTVPGDEEASHQFEVMTDENGHFNLMGIEPGTYEVRVKKSTTLQNLLTVDLQAGNNSLDMGTLREGDANNDNVVTILDFSMLASTFGKCEGDDGYDEQADFNGDGCVTILDFSLLASNFGQVGDMAPTAVPSRTPQDGKEGQVSPITSAGEVLIIANAQPYENDAFCMALEVQAGKQAVDGVSAHLDFPAALLAVEGISMGEALPLSLQEQFDNQAGTLDIAAGALSDFPTGTFELAEVCFSVTGDISQSTIAFQFDARRQTDVTFGGASILTSATNATLADTPDDNPTVVALHKLDVTPQLPARSLYLLLALVVVGMAVRKIRS